MEAFLKLEVILFPEFDPSKSEWKLYSALKEFILLSYSLELDQKGLNRLNVLANIIIEEWKDLDNNSTVYCKLHHLSHYCDLIRKYGPLYLYANLHYEHKHQFCKNCARVMRNFIDPAWTIHYKHQALKALIEDNENFLETDFFPSVPTNRPSLLTQLPPNCSPLPASDNPFRLHQNVLRKTKHTAKDYWILTKEFFRNKATKQIYCKGMILEIEQAYSDNGKAIGPKLFNNSLKFLKVFAQERFISLEHLHFTNDYLLVVDDEDSENNQNFLLVKWIH